MPSYAFSPLGNSVVISGTITSSRTQLPTTGGAARVYNSGSVIAFVRFGDSTVVAAATDSFVAPGSTEVFNIPSSCTHVAGITASSTASIYVERGDGG